MADRNGYIGRAPADSSIVIARQEYTPSGVTTDFTFTSGYTVGYVDAYLNGVRLLEATDYNATDGATVSLVTAAEADDILELVAYKAFNVGNVTDASGNFTVGSDLTVGGSVGISSNVDVTGIVTAGEFSGDGSSLTGITTGVSINAAGGALQRVMLGNVTSGVANTMANTGSLYWNDNTSTLYASNVNVSGTMTQEDVQNVDSTGIVTAGRGFRATLGGVVVTAGISTFSAGIDLNSTLDVDGDTQLDDLNVAGVATFSDDVRIAAGGLDVVGVVTSNTNVDATNVTAIGGNFTGILTALTVEGTSFAGDGSGLTGVGGEVDITSVLFL